ncbi:MAG: hypothetical protein RL215_3439 [Planctomycetota bacterium]
MMRELFARARQRWSSSGEMFWWSLRISATVTSSVSWARSVVVPA